MFDFIVRRSLGHKGIGEFGSARLSVVRGRLLIMLAASQNSVRKHSSSSW